LNFGFTTILGTLSSLSYLSGPCVCAAFPPPLILVVVFFFLFLVPLCLGGLSGASSCSCSFFVLAPLLGAPLLHLDAECPGSLVRCRLGLAPPSLRVVASLHCVYYMHMYTHTHAHTHAYTRIHTYTHAPPLCASHVRCERWTPIVSSDGHLLFLISNILCVLF
jgi:hypothetical protein